MRQDLTENEWAQYAKDGYLALGPVMEADEVKALAQRMEDIMMGRIRYDDMLMQLDKGGDYADSAPQVKKFHGPTLNYRKIQDLEKDPLFLSFMQKDLFLKMCNRVYGTHAGISSWRAMFMNKPAHQGTISSLGIKMAGPPGAWIGIPCSQCGRLYHPRKAGPDVWKSCPAAIDWDFSAEWATRFQRS